MPQPAAVFETTYRNYLKQLAAVDLAARAERLGVETSGEGLTIPLYASPYTLSAQGAAGPDGRPANFAVSVVLCCYVLQCPETVPSPGDWMTFRDFKDAGPLVGYFTANTQKIIETAFAGNPEALVQACRPLDARPFDDGSAYDVSLTFDFLPRIPVLLRFNDRDREFPAQCAVLFPRSAEAFLDMECMAIGGTLLAGMLTQSLQGRDGTSF
jgi:hypothetical protein